MEIEKCIQQKYQRANMWMTKEDIEVIRRCTEYAWYVCTWWNYRVQFARVEDKNEQDAKNTWMRIRVNAQEKLEDVLPLHAQECMIIEAISLVTFF